MYKAFLIALFTSFLSIANASHISIPRERSLVHYERRIPSTLMERAANGVFARQDTTCTADQTTCDDGTCCAGACCGDGCCPTDFTCDTSGATPACCAQGQNCNGQIAGCTDPTLVPCDGQDFCCPEGEACSLDASGNAQCGGTAAPPNSGETAIGVALATTTHRVSTPATGPTTPIATSFYGSTTAPFSSTSRTISSNAAAFSVDGGLGKTGIALAGLILALMA